jgi:electron transfer flavoprotein beta subunit
MPDAMKILVCIKHVPDTEAKIKIGSDGKNPDLAGVKMIVSPYEEFALEEALLIKDSGGAAEVVVLCLGDEGAQASLRQALAMGADRAIHVQDASLPAADALTRARVLAAAIREEAPELVFTGKIGVGDDVGQVGPMLGELLDRPHVGAVFELTLSAGRFTAHRGIEGAVEIVLGDLPAVFAWDKGEHTPRYPSLKGIMAAKKKPFVVRTAAELAVAVQDAKVERESLELPPGRPPGRLLTGDAGEAASTLARLLREEAKVI